VYFRGTRTTVSLFHSLSLVLSLYTFCFQSIDTRIAADGPLQREIDNLLRVADWTNHPTENLWLLQREQHEVSDARAYKQRRPEVDKNPSSPSPLSTSFSSWETASFQSSSFLGLSLFLLYVLFHAPPSPLWLYFDRSSNGPVILKIIPPEYNWEYGFYILCKLYPLFSSSLNPFALPMKEILSKLFSENICIFHLFAYKIAIYMCICIYRYIYLY